MDPTSLIIQLVAGAVGGNVAGGILKNLNLGMLGNSLAGVVGGGIGGQIIGAVAGGNFDGVIGDVAGGGVGGAVVLAVVGLVKNMMNMQKHKVTYSKCGSRDSKGQERLLELWQQQELFQ